MNEAEQVGAVLREGREQGWPFDEAWRSAIRMLRLDADADEQARAELADARKVILESRPYFEAAYRRETPPDEVRAAVALKAEERFADAIEVDLADLDVDDVIAPRRLVLG